MTTLDLSDYDASVQEALSAPIVPEPFFACLIAVIIIAWTAGFILIGRSANTDKQDDSQRFEHLGNFCVVVAIVSTVSLILCGPLMREAKTPSFADYVENAYGLNSTDLPASKPYDGSLPVVWEQDDEVHSGTLNLLDNKLSIKETNGDYLEVRQ